MKYGHRRDIDGYANAISEFDNWLNDFIPKMNVDDLLIITADHGCDPLYKGTDHTRENVPMIRRHPTIIHTAAKDISPCVKMERTPSLI